VAIFYAFSALLCLVTLLLVFQDRSPAGWWLWSLAALLVVGGALAAVSLYRGKPLTVAWQNRPHFQFLGLFTRFMKARLQRARSREDLLELLAVGVRDLGFDRVEVWVGGRLHKAWDNPHPQHPERDRLQAEENFAEGHIKVNWSRPSHLDEGYNEYLTLAWHRFLVAWKGAMARHVTAFPQDPAAKVLELPRKK
jgi:hypothetical protein